MAANMAGRVPVFGDVLAQFITAGQTIGGGTLTRFYATHVFLLPAAIFGVLSIHLFLVVHHAISEPPGKGRVVDPESTRKTTRS